MMTNHKPWQTTVNPHNMVHPLSQQKNSLSVAKKNTNSSQQSAKMKVIMPKRYSIDDNGGGYLGL